MNSIAFSTATLTEEQARDIASAYIRGEKEPQRIAELLEVPSFDLNLLMHPLVRKFIVQFQRSLRTDYSLFDHMAKLKEIRNAAMDDDNFKVALTAEVQIGKAAGLYDPKPFGDDDEGDGPVDPTTLSTDQLRRRLAGMIGAEIKPTQKSLPSPSVENLDDDEVDIGLA
jgi:hypothetical protein